MAEEPEIARETKRRLFGTIPVAQDGTATITLDTLKFVGLAGMTPNEFGSVTNSMGYIGGSGGRI